MVSEKLSLETPDSEGGKISTAIKSEVNFMRLPFFALSRKDSSQRIETEYKEVVERNGKKTEIIWTVTANAKFGYPTPFDKKVHKAIESIISKRDLPIKNPIDFSIYEICKLLNISDSGRNYEMVKNALVRTAFAGIQSKGTFYSKSDKRWIEDAFHLYDRVVFIGETLPDGKIAETNYLFLGEWYLKNLNAFYVKPLDYDFFLSLKSSIAGRLYEFLSLQFYGLGCKPCTIDYRKLCQVLPIAEQRYVSKAVQNLETAHKELIKRGFVSKVEWYVQPSWAITYFPGKKAREELRGANFENQQELSLLKHESRSSLAIEMKLSTDEAKIIGQLIQRGITVGTARRLVNAYPNEQICRQIEVFDWLKKKKSPLVGKNPAGFLRKSIEENYQPPEEYCSYLEKKLQRLEAEKAMAQKQAEEEEREKELSKIRVYKESLSQEEKVKLREEAELEIRSSGQYNEKFITDYLIQAKENELIARRFGIKLPE